MKNKGILIAAIVTSSFLLAATLPIQAADVTLTDPSGDVSMIDIYGEQSTYVTSNPDINVDNIDITRLTYTKTGGSVTLTMEVKGVIEDRGSISIANGDYPENLTEINDVEYQLMLDTKLVGSAADSYTVIYVNKHCQYTTLNSETPVNLTSPNGYSVSGNMLTVTFPLSDSNEVYTQLNSTTTFMKVNITALSNATDPSDFSKYYTILEDVAPNQPLAVLIVDGYPPNVGSVGESLQFNSSVVPLTGQPPFTYAWKFGDGGTSTQQNPTHTYSNAGTYTYNLTVTDNANAKAYGQGTVEITSPGGGGGAASSPLLLFLAVIIVIAAIGVVVLVVIIRRR
jgi:hypothetical protein